MDYSRLKHRIVVGFAWEAASKVAIQIISWTATILVARILLPSDYGIVAISGVIVGFLVVVAELGLSQGLVNRKDITVSEQHAIFWLSVAVGIALYGLLYVTAPLIANLYGLDALTAIMRASGLVLILASLRVVPFAILMRNLDFRYRALVEMVSQLVQAATLLSLALWGFGPWSLVWSFIAAHCITTGAYLRFFNAFPRLTVDFMGTWPIVWFGSKLMVSKVIGFFILRADIFIIGSLLGERAAGFYSMAYQLATIPVDKIGSIFHRITFPAVSRVKEDTERSRHMFLEMHRYLVTITCPVLIGILLVADDAVVVLLTEKWLPIVPLLQVLSGINLLRVSAMLIAPTLEGRGNANRVLLIHVIAVTVLPTAFFLGAQWGLNGVMYAWVIAYPPLYLYLLRSISQELELSIGQILRSAKSALIACTAMTLGVLSLQQVTTELVPSFRLALCIIIGGILYVGTFLLFYYSEFAELKRRLALLRAE